MSDVTDLGPILELAKLKRKDPDKYKEMISDIKDVTRDMVSIAKEITQEQRDEIDKKEKQESGFK